MPGLIVTIGGDSRPLKGELDAIEKLVRRAGGGLKFDPFPAGQLNTSAVREFLVLIREISRGNWTRVPGSFSLLMSQMGGLKYIFSATAGAIVGTVAALALITRHFIIAAREAKNLEDLMNLSRIKFSALAEQMKQGAQRSQEQSDWLANLADKQETLADKTNDAVKALREQAKKERELAASRGASESRLAQMDIQTAKAELAMLQQGVSEAKAKMDKDLADENAASANQTSPGYAERGARIALAQSHLQDLGRVVDAIQERMAHTMFPDLSKPLAGGMMGSGGIQGAAAMRAANPNDIFTVKVEGKEFRMSFQEAQDAFHKLAQEEADLSKTQKEIDDLLQEKKKLTEQDVESLNRLTRQRDEQAAQLGIDEKMLPQLADAKGRREHGELNSLQRVGAYAPPAVVVDIAKAQLKELKGINFNTSGIGGGSGSFPGRARY